MIKSIAFVCAIAATCLFLQALLFPQSLSAGPTAPGVTPRTTISGPLPGMVERFQAEKAQAVQHELPAQF
jgi:hypothetical protein